MKKNMGTADRALRLLIAAALCIGLIAGKITGGATIAAGIVAIIFAFTAAVRTCPLYLPFGISTSNKK